MSADGVAAVVSGVDLALVSWMDGPVVDLSSVSGQPRPHEHQRIGRCLCAKDAAVAESQVAAQHTNSTVPQLKSTLKKQQQQQQHRPAPSTSYSASKSPSIDRHIVPQVVQVVSQRTKQHGQVSNSSSTTAGILEKGAQQQQQQQQQPLEVSNRNRISRANTSATSLPAGHPSKPILSRKNWNNTIDGGPHQQQQQHHHQPSCLRRYGSQQSCKSATTLRSYVTSTSRGNFKVNECNKICLFFFFFFPSASLPAGPFSADKTTIQ